MMRSPQAPIGGFTLIEMLIALLVFSYGLLGWAALQLTALEGSRSAELRTIATLQAQDLADRMRANMAAVNAGQYTADVKSDNNCRSIYFKHAGGTPAACTPTQLAQDDLYDWDVANGELLPGGAGMVCRDSVANPGDRTPAAPKCDGLSSSPYVVLVWWNDPVPRQGVRQRYVELRFQP